MEPVGCWCSSSRRFKYFFFVSNSTRIVRNSGELHSSLCVVLCAARNTSSSSNILGIVFTVLCRPCPGAPALSVYSWGIRNNPLTQFSSYPLASFSLLVVHFFFVLNVPFGLDEGFVSHVRPTRSSSGSSLAPRHSRYIFISIVSLRSKKLSTCISPVVPVCYFFFAAFVPVSVPALPLSSFLRRIWWSNLCAVEPPPLF